MKRQWHWMSFEKHDYMGKLIDYLNRNPNIVDYKYIQENENYIFFMFKIEV